jgi:hypothetical protein
MPKAPLAGRLFVTAGRKVSGPILGKQGRRSSGLLRHSWRCSLRRTGEPSRPRSDKMGRLCYQSATRRQEAAAEVNEMNIAEKTFYEEIDCRFP